MDKIMKFLTFSFDDGVTQDRRLIEILNKYGLKSTFNINSSLLGLKGFLNQNNRITDHNKVFPYEIKDLYAGHEVAVHTLTHPNLTLEEKDTIIYQVEEDRKQLSKYFLCSLAANPYHKLFLLQQQEKYPIHHKRHTTYHQPKRYLNIFFFNSQNKTCYSN